GLIDNTHAPTTELLDDAVVRDGLADHSWRILRGRNGQVNESRGLGAISRGLLLQNRVSNNVGGVKHFRAHYTVHSEKSAISLSLKMCRSNQGSLAIKFQVRNSVRPMHLFGPQLRS